MKLISTFIFSLIYFGSLAQANFVKGYYVNNNNEKIEGFIYNLDWQFTPSNFRFKENNSASEIRLNPTNAKKVALNNKLFVSADVSMDESSDRFGNLSTNTSPTYVRKEVFLEILADGNTTLLMYDISDFTRFFLKTSEKGIEPLIFRRFSLNSNVKENLSYKQQLKSALSNDNTKNFDFLNVKYDKKSLTELVNLFNGTLAPVSEKKDKKVVYRVSIRPGVTYSNLSFSNLMIADNKTKFDSKIGFRIGLENEFVLPFNNGKWSLIAEPTYQHYQNTYSNNVNDPFSLPENYKVTYNSIEVPLAFRYYIFLKNKSSLFLNAGYLIDVAFSSKILRNNSPFLEVKPHGNVFAGLGYKLNSRLFTELRYNHNRPLYYYANYSSNFSSTAVILGFTLKK